MDEVEDSEGGCQETDESFLPTYCRDLNLTGPSPSPRPTVAVGEC